MLLGKLYKERNLISSAVSSFKDALGINPLALEAVLSLIDLSVPLNEITAIVEQYDEGKMSWIRSFITSAEHAKRKEEKEAMKICKDMYGEYPDNISIQLLTARMQSELNQKTSAIYTYKRIRALDPNCLDQMDEYAGLLRGEENVDELNRLTHELISVDANRAECWVAVALYSDLKGEKEKALGFVEKAISINKRHVYAYHLKGTILLSLNQAQAAVDAHFKGYALKMDIAAFKGLVKANLCIPK
jgi:tetratricopeptide (TPR) repeat protein